MRWERSALPVCLHQEHLLLSREYFRARGLNLSPSNLVTVLRIAGALQESAVISALNALLRRHASLRSAFAPNPRITSSARQRGLAEFAATGVFASGFYSQSVAEPEAVDLRVLNIEEAGSLEQVEQLAAQEARCGFDHAEPPLLRGTLVRAGTEQSYLILSVDHLAADAWSMRILRRELAQRLIASAEWPTDDAECGAIELALRQQTFDQDEHRPSLDYWVGHWTKFAPSRIGFADLPFALLPPAQPAYEFGTFEQDFDAGTSNFILDFARTSRVTLYVLFLAIFTRILARYTKKHALGMWGHFANRTAVEPQDAVGWFAQTQLIGLDLHGTDSTRAILDRCRDATLHAAEHQHIPVMQVWRAMNGYPSHPDAKVLLDVSPFDEPLPSAGGLRLEHLPEITPITGRFANLGVYVRHSRNRIRISVQYLEDRFPAEAVKRLLSDFEQETMQMIAHPLEERR